MPVWLSAVLPVPVAFSELAQVFSAAVLRVDVPGHSSMPMAEGALLSLRN